VNWGVLIYEVVGRAIPHIGREPSYLSPFLLHLYKHYDCITTDEEDLLTIAAEEVAYKIRPAVTDSSTSSDPIIPDAPPSSPGSPPPSSWRPNSPPPPPPHPHPEAGPSRDTMWRNVDLSAWDFPENPFKRVHDELEDLQTQYYRLEHMTKGPARRWITADPETSSRSWRRGRTGRNWTKRRRSSTRSGRRTRTCTHMWQP
jgi:hypothetical protein